MADELSEDDFFAAAAPALEVALRDPLLLQAIAPGLALDGEQVAALLILIRDLAVHLRSENSTPNALTADLLARADKALRHGRVDESLARPS